MTFYLVTQWASIDNVPTLLTTATIRGGIILRPYQRQAIDEINTNRPLIYLATGSGKSVIFKELASDFVKRCKKVCFVVYGKSIVDQAARKHFTQISNLVCVIMGDQRYRANNEIYCCSISTLNRNVKVASHLISECDLFIIDEAHNATSDLYSAFLDAIPEDKMVVGLTATPFYIGNRGHSYWTQIIHPVTVGGLIQQGYLHKPQVFGPPESSMSTEKVRTTAGEFNNKQLFKANDKMAIYGSIIDSWFKYAEGLRTICFGINKQHAFNLKTMFEDRGVPAAYADADTPQEERLELIERLVRRDDLVLCNVNIFSTGVDIPELECGLMARPTKSKVLWIQQVGRILRTHPEKEKAIIIDNGGNCFRNCHPLEDQEADTEPIKPRAQSAGSTSGAPSIKQCPKCHYVTMATAEKCLDCGHVFVKQQNKVEVKKVDLIEYEHGFDRVKIDKNDRFETLMNWVHLHIEDGCPPKIKNQIKSIVRQMAIRKWKNNSFFFKVKDNEEIAPWIKFPAWVEQVEKKQAQQTTRISLKT